MSRDETQTPSSNSYPEYGKQTKRPYGGIRVALGEDENRNHEDTCGKDVRNRLDDQWPTVEEELEAANG